MTEINRFPILTADEEFRLAVRLKKYNDMEAAEKLVVSNLRFVVKIAHEYRNYGLKLADLVQEGNIGLMHAVKKFDPYKGYRLISYAVWWIRAYIQNYIIKSWSLVKIGTTQTQRKLFFKLAQATIISSLGLVIANYILHRDHMLPRSVVMLDGVLTFLAMGGLYAALRWLTEAEGKYNLPGDAHEPVLIVGAGAAGESLLREFERNPRAGVRGRGPGVARPDAGRHGRRFRAAGSLARRSR